MTDPDQLALVPLVGAARRAASSTSPRPDLAATDPVARVIVDTGLAHLDRPFDYTVPADLDETARPGARVKVRFAGRDLDGFVVERVATSDHDGRLAPLRRVVSPEAVLTPAVLELARALATRLAGTVGDVLRLAIPPRHARAEAALPLVGPGHAALPEPTRAAWGRYAAGPAFLRRLGLGGNPPAAVVTVPSGGDPALDWPRLLAEAVAASCVGGRGSIVVVPDHRDVTRLDRALLETIGPGRHVSLTADQGPQARYTAWLKVLRGHADVVIGNRAAAFAPVADLGLVAWFDDGDDLLEEPRAPYPHVRDILLARAEIEGAAALTAGPARSVDVQALVDRGVLASVEAPRETLRQAAPRVRVAGEGTDVERDPAAASARLPTSAWHAAKTALAAHPVLVQVPRRGYQPSLACQTCRRPARCRTCQGPLARPGSRDGVVCRWCLRPGEPFRCPSCDGETLRTAVVGARRTAEELGRAFPGVPVHTSGADQVRDRVAATPALVIATPGAEPVADGGYGAALLLDAWAMLDRPSMRAGEETLRRWLTAASLVRGDGEVVLCGAPAEVTLPSVEALVRWDPVWYASRELADRTELRLPPTVTMASLRGGRRVVKAAIRALVLPPGAEVLGPHEIETNEIRADATGADAAPVVEALIRVPLDESLPLARALADLRGVRSARKDSELLGVHFAVADLD